MNKKTFKIYLAGDSYSKLNLAADTMNILNINGQDTHIDLADYVEVGESISWQGSWDWEYYVYNGSDRTIMISVFMSVSDSEGYYSEQEWEDVGCSPRNEQYFYIESGNGQISSCYIRITATADDADDYKYTYRH